MLRKRTKIKVQRTKIKSCFTTFPVILSAGSHPFPSRTRKLSLLEPMVLRGKLRGRVGSRRDYFKSPLRVELERASFVLGAGVTGDHSRTSSMLLSGTNCGGRSIPLSAHD